MIERYGSGIKRILTICFDYGVIAPIFEEVQEGFKVVLFKEKLNVVEDVVDNVVNDPINDPIKDILYDTLNERQTKIVKMLKKVSNSTYEQLANQCGVSIKTIKRDLKKLQDLNIIKRVGSKKTGHWEVIK